MRHFFAFTLCCLSLLSVDASEPENPLQGSLRDPWQVVTGGEKKTKVVASETAPHLLPTAYPQTETSSFGPSFADFQLQYDSQLDLSTLENKGEDSVAHRYARGEKEWDHFHPSQQILPAGTIFYGDPSVLAANRTPSTTTIDMNRWAILISLTLLVAMLLLLGTYFWMRHRRNLSRAP
tara:strand:- start:44 stop:580 length:537 start_codon:yes stop_codon:yes gene_type:complete